MTRKPGGSVALDSVPIPDRVVRVSLPPKIAYDLKRLQQVQASILDRLGHPACHSGWDIRFDVIRSFGVDPAGNIHDLFAGGIVING